MGAITKLDERFTETDIDSEIVIMRIDTGEFFALAGTAAAVWRLIDGRRDRAQLLADLSEEYSADPNRIAGEVDDFLAQLKETGLLAGD